MLTASTECSGRYEMSLLDACSCRAGFVWASVRMAASFVSTAAGGKDTSPISAMPVGYVAGVPPHQLATSKVQFLQQLRRPSRETGSRARLRGRQDQRVPDARW